MGKLGSLGPAGWEVLWKAGQVGSGFIWHRALSPSVTLAPFPKASLMEPLSKKSEILSRGELGGMAGRGNPSPPMVHRVVRTS